MYTFTWNYINKLSQICKQTLLSAVKLDHVGLPSTFRGVWWGCPTPWSYQLDPREWPETQGQKSYHWRLRCWRYCEVLPPPSALCPRYHLRKIPTNQSTHTHTMTCFSWFIFLCINSINIWYRISIEDLLYVFVTSFSKGSLLNHASLQVRKKVVQH